MTINPQNFTRIESQSLTHYVAGNYAEWEKSASRAESLYARPLTALSMPVTAIIDAVAHAVLAIVKLPVALVIGMPWSLIATKFNTRTPPQDIKITSVIVHLYAAAYSAISIITLPIVLIANPGKAAGLSYHKPTQPILPPIESSDSEGENAAASSNQATKRANQLKVDENFAKKLSDTLTKQLGQSSQPASSTEEVPGNEAPVHLYTQQPENLQPASSTEEAPGSEVHEHLSTEQLDNLQPESTTEEVLDYEVYERPSIQDLSNILKKKPAMIPRRPSTKNRLSNINNLVKVTDSGKASCSIELPKDLPLTELKSLIPTLIEEPVSPDKKVEPRQGLTLSDLTLKGTATKFLGVKSTSKLNLELVQRSS